MALAEATTHPKRAQDTTGQDVFAMATVAGEVVQGVALIAPDETQVVNANGDVPVTLDSEVVAVDATGQGDVPVTLDSEQVEIKERTLTTLCDTEDASGDTQLVAAPGPGYRIVISSLLVQNESTSPVTVLLKSGSTAKRRVWCQDQGDGLEQTFANGRELRLGTNEALNINLSAAVSVGYSIDYWTETV